MEAVAEGDFGAAVARLRVSEPFDAAAAKRLEGMIAELARLKHNYAVVRLVLPRLAVVCVSQQPKLHNVPAAVQRPSPAGSGLSLIRVQQSPARVLNL